VGKMLYPPIPLDIQVGAYYNVVRPDGAGEATLRFQIQLLLPSPFT
jgi:hypothetical protein